MKTVSMLEFRRDAESIIQQIQQGQHLILTYRGKPLARLEPIRHVLESSDDPFYSLYELADTAGESLTNKDMDRIIYEP